MKNVLIVGGGGFIGRHLVMYLFQIGDYKLKVLDIRKPDWLPRDVEFIEGSFLDQSNPAVKSSFLEVDVVYHLASTTIPQTSNSDIVFDIESNLIGSLALLNYAVEAGVSKFIFTSSGGTIYGPSNDPIVDEFHETNPNCSYGIVKLAIEKYLSLYSNLHGLSTYSLRISNPYGKYQSIEKMQGAIPIFCHRIMNDKSIEIWGDGSIERDFIYTSDLVSAMEKVMHLQSRNEVINIGSMASVSLNEIIKTIEKVSGKKAIVKYLPSRKVDIPRVCLSNDYAKKTLGWSPTVSLIQGLSEVLEEYHIKEYWI
ncbi:dTDP-4-dehydro-6-deoxyglucose reductase [Vibrio thalassae]|uniref:dTDP-4-dehydro-6-deoxyglucose reductase n=1 Tax=Vibrio thalassae TaxID=1243014 RepID=A0A240EMB7_9VIBR|nr:NAD-dependent epimerase/dehydratase family protein [Vibrio thalassae]SNX49764.1 dTDP-4-dehydro-6-deoxyglucose reductase [Vibrio thalassae]